MYIVTYEKKALRQLKLLQRQKKLLRKIESILMHISHDPYSPKHKFERLKYNLAGFCSKRVDEQHRIVYQVRDQEILVIVISVMGHYE